MRPSYYIFEQYDIYIGSSRNDMEWNTFTHFVRFLKKSKNKNDSELQKALTYLSLLLDQKAVELEYTDGSSSQHNEFFCFTLIQLRNRYSLYYDYQDYNTMKLYCYTNSILKYILKNVAIENITGLDFRMLFKLIKVLKDTNEDNLFDDEIEYYTKDKIYKALQEKYPEYNY